MKGPAATTGPLLFGELIALRFLLLHLGSGLYLGVVGIALLRQTDPGAIGWVIPGLQAGLLLLGAGLLLVHLARGRRFCVLSLRGGVSSPLALGERLCAVAFLQNLSQAIAGYYGELSLWRALGWVGLVLAALVFTYPAASLRGGAVRLWNQPLVPLLFVVSALLPASLWLIGLVLELPEGFLGDPGRLHHLGISYGQGLAILLGLLLIRLYALDPEQMRRRRFTFATAVVSSVVLSSLGMMILSVGAHPLFALAAGLVAALGAFCIISLIVKRPEDPAEAPEEDEEP